MLGPTIEAVQGWLTVDPQDAHADYTNNPSRADRSSLLSPVTHTDADHFSTPAAAPTGPRELSALFANLTMGLWSSVVGTSADNSASAKNKAGAASKTPADSFTGIVMHYFIDSPQVGPR